ncbi:MAG: hypothetical protein KF727_13915 [Microbacteriaceae bacterium]|jgi:hypothetical protein|nr:hypothetical protein [Microbacteriaceae bacterium]
MRAHAKPPRRKWPWIIVGVILAGLIAYALYAVATNKPVAEPTPEPTTSAATPVDVAPTGCLGGESRDAEMLLAADGAAPHTTNGAVEFATAYVRWMHQFPNPSADDAAKAKAVFAASNDDFDLVGYLDGKPNLSGGVVEDGRTFYSSTVPGVWDVESESDDKVTVSIGTAFVVDGRLSASLRGSITVTVVWEDGAWRFESSEGTRTTEDLFSTGTGFTGGC